MSPQLALRVAIIGGIALAMFAVIFFRLWYLQILSGDQYLAEANDNRVREVKIQAPRGEIVDRDGSVLVANRPSTVVKISPKDLPEREDAKTRLYQRLADLTGQTRREIRTSVREQLRAQPFAAATVKTDVSHDTVAYIEENPRRFPGVEIETVHLREYPHDNLGAHLFGFVGEVTKEQLEDERYRGVALGDRVGQDGLEYQYDRFLRGENGATRLQVDAMGNLRQEIGRREPKQGRQLRLTMDLDVQRAGQQALGDARGAFTVMDARNGEIVALGSSPSFDPNVFAKVFKQSDYERLTDEANGAPLQNRAIAGLYPTGSVFKPITAVAGLMGGLIGPDTVINDGGSITVGDRRFENDRGAVHGAVDLRRAMEVSSDVYFYLLGRDSWDDNLIQRWARQLGLGHPTGVDLPGEADGLVPSEHWRNEEFQEFQDCASEEGLSLEAAVPECGFINRPWSPGDNINLSIGQGDLAATPLQMATAYAAIANGGFVITPHLGLRVEDDEGRALQQFETPRREKVQIDGAYRDAIMDGLRRAAQGPGGTSTAVFEGFPVPVAGKTGTAERGNDPSQSWYLALAPADKPQYVVAVTFERGGYGAETAAPAARKILAALFDVKDDKREEAVAEARATAVE